MLRQGDELAALTGQPLAKSAALPDSPARRRAIRAASALPQDFRHEFLSLQLAERYLARGGETEQSDLLLHVLAGHHGYGRPFAPVCIDPDPPLVRSAHGGTTIEVATVDRIAWPPAHELASGISERFWRLTRRYGWWGLAYLEAILRLGDWYGSRWVVEDEPPERILPAHRLAPSQASQSKALVLTGMDGANPLGFLAAIGALVVLHQAGHRTSRLAWRRNGLAWHPRLTDLPTDDPATLSELLAENLRGGHVSEEAYERRKRAEQQFSHTKKEINNKRANIKKRGLSIKERKQAFEEELSPLERELEGLRKTWLEALGDSVPRPELALGKNIDCTEPEYRAVVEPLLESAQFNDRQAVDMLSAFCSAGCLSESPTKRKHGRLASTPFAFISGSGHQDFLDTAGALLKWVSAVRLRSTLTASWDYEDEGLSMRWDPAEDRRYALMDRDPTASGNKPHTVWMANLLAYHALALFTSAPARSGLATVGWTQTAEEPFFTWPLWTYPIGPDSIRSLMSLSELYGPTLSSEDRAALRARGVRAVRRSRRIKVGSGANFKVNFTPSRQV